MTDSVLTYRDCYEECKALALEIIEDNQDECETLEDFMDKAHDYIDGHEWVIYYYRAHQFLLAVHSDIRAEAEDLFQDTCCEADSYDHYATLLTYWGLTIWVSNFIEESLKEAA